MQLSSSYSQRFAGLKVLLTALVALALATPPAMAQTAGQITIGGKVYGGGKEGAIRTDNDNSDPSKIVTDPANPDYGKISAKDVTLKTTDFTSAATQASQVTINSADDDANVHITAVFGGGEKGRAYGKTNVTINGGTIGINKDKDAASLAAYNALPAENKPVNGNAFGAGDGQGADVFGGTHVLVTAGTINGSVYGGGNQADLVGSTELTLQGGQYVGAVFGGAKQADIWGHTFVNVDGAHALRDLHIIDVYGGNDIAGNIKPAPAADYPNWTWAQQAHLSLPTAFTLPSTGHLTNYPSGHVTSEWNAFVYASKGTTHKTLIDNIFGGGNGDYGETDADGVYTTGAYAGKNLKKPVIDRTYLQIEGGMYGSLYGGGNAATVAQSTDICLVNSTTASSDYIASLTEPSKSRFSSTYQFNRVFGGNNKEPMAIRPNWYLEEGTINNLYSGGNAGPMTYFAQTSTGAASLAGNAGIILHVESELMEVNNVYGGCRMADVDPKAHQGLPMTINAETIAGTTYSFPANYAARVLITGGNINNVYGGNDVSGNVYYGSLVEIRSSINENVYGAGNGSYAYTDNVNLKGDKEYGDYYYNGGTGGLASAQALSKHRPNAAQSYVHVAGTVSKPTYIGGAIYCGGNSATLRALGDDATALKNAKSELHIGSYVIADNVFLGSNGENMVKSALPSDLLQVYKNGPVGFSTYATANSISGPYSSMDLTDSDQFEEYMRGVEVAIKPVVTFDDGYVSHSTKFGSLYCGGNVGSMSADGYFNVDFLQKLVIYNKLVGGCNNANVAKTAYNAFHMGGLTGAPDAANNKVLLTVAGLQLEPRVLTGNVKDGFSLDTWNKAPIVGVSPTKYMLQGANIYGGCYSSGYIRGGVNINIQEDAISPNVFTGSGVTYDEVRQDVLASTLACYGGGYGEETEIWGNVTIDITGNGRIMKAYGGGEMGVVGKLDRGADGLYGQEFDPYETTKPVQEWYSQMTAENLYGYNTFKTEYLSRDHYVAKFLKKDPDDPSSEDGIFNTTVNLNANLLDDDALNVAKLYGGGFQGTVSGNTIVNLNRGRVYDAFGGASNADILGHTEMYVGKSSAPTVVHNVYGANDFGGLIVGYDTRHVDNNKDGDTTDTMEKIICQSYVEYSSGNVAGDLFGGPCGAYDYEEDRYYNWDRTDPLNPVKGAHKAVCKPQLLKDLLTGAMLTPLSGAGYAANSFVNVISQSALDTDVIGGSIFGAGQGMKGSINLADERGSYVRLMSATKSQRSAAGELSQRVYGAGFCSNTNRSIIDAHTGYFGTLFGGAHGITYQELTTMQLTNPQGHYETNYMGYRSAVRLYEMANNEMDIYGGGANAGAMETGVVLQGGEARNVYGASYAQGISYASSVEVPETSTSRVKAIFGGAEGGQDNYPCDAYNTYVTWKSPNARVQDAIYGGNNQFRMTRNAYLAINAPVKDFNDQLTNVFGGGYGPETVTLYTSIGLQDGAQVANVYGGGNNGQVLDTPSFRYYLDDGELQCSATDTHVKPAGDGHKTYPATLAKDKLTAKGETPIYGYQKYLRDTEVIGFHRWIYDYCWDGHTLDDRGQPIGSYLSKEHGHAHPVNFLSTQQPEMKNTNIFILKGALVAENAYGGGLGAQALVSGETSIHLMGGTVKGDIYGGGQEANIEEYPHLIFPAGGQHELTISQTNVELQGGIARNVYGGGLKGRVTGATNVTLGTKDQHEFDFYGTRVAGQYEHQTYYGDPIVERSLYGGGQMGPVHGTAYLTLNQGHVGYKYDASQEADKDVTITVDGNPTPVNIRSNKDCYVENLDLNAPGDNFLDQNGNVFGAGYGEGATVDVTYVNIYGGTIRNSLYGGGEIAAVGRATMRQTGAHPVVNKPFELAGRTHVYMYNGLVQGDVFGGGRGYSYDLTGNEIIGKELYTDGYVFGTTDVEIRGGTVGTPATLADGHGNVFGGGNIGYCFTDAVQHGERGDGGGEGRYYTNKWKCTQCDHFDFMHDEPTVCGFCGKSPSATDELFRTTFQQIDAYGNVMAVKNLSLEAFLSEDCRVVVSPYAQVTAEGGISIRGNSHVLPDGTVLSDKTFAKNDYVPTDYLDLLKDKNTDHEQWAKVSPDGVTIRNAVFAGGNVSAGSDKVYANAVTVFGNATATVRDVFFRDFITLGTEHIGGLYGDGNLTFVDGYRELNITDFGTDYYGQSQEITLQDYELLSDRERAYFKLQYECLRDIDHDANTGEAYVPGVKIDEDTYKQLSDESKAEGNWRPYGFCNIYAGRIMNTIQRADFCGIFGSRIVLEGAQDRVPEVVDYTQYTINRVGEVSLNAKTVNGVKHGNYVGFYNVVNYLGALTSDVTFKDKRQTENTDGSYKTSITTPAGDVKDYGTATYYEWKEANKTNRKRNNGSCHNKVALASGVYLELVQEQGSTRELKNYGYITGVIELDLINVMQGLGGGYVYAKNEHGTPDPDSDNGEHQNLSYYNLSAKNKANWSYDNTTGKKQPIETSGNFIHATKQIIDDCFPGGGQYDPDQEEYTTSPAHYWYLKGEVYVYDQYVSAYTGSATAYAENIDLPLTITAGSHGKLDLLNIKRNKYAYYSDKNAGQPLGANEHMIVNNVTYGLNDVITYWDWMQLSDSQKALFVDETYTTVKEYSLTDGTVVPVGTVMLPDAYTAYIAAHPTVYDTELEHNVNVTNVLRPSNNVEHNNGYVLALSLTNPIPWDEWYSPTTGDTKINTKDYNALGDKSGYLIGPTYSPTQSGVYGQRTYNKDDVVTKAVVDTYNAMDKTSIDTERFPQTSAVPTYISTAPVSYEYTDNVTHELVQKNLQAGVGISQLEYAQIKGTARTAFEPAYTCLSTYEIDKMSNQYVYFAELISQTRYNELKQALVAGGLTTEQATRKLEAHFDVAYSITNDGWYGGNYFTANQNYRVLDSWASLAEADRENFQFRYDALDLLLHSNPNHISPTDPAFDYYPGNGNIHNMDEYDRPGEQLYQATQPVHYWATWLGTSATPGETFTYTDQNGTLHTITEGVENDREIYEAIPNEKYHYVGFNVTDADIDTDPATPGNQPRTFYIVKEQFAKGDQPYLVGQILDEATFGTLDPTQQQPKVGEYTFTTAGQYYFCRDSYNVNEHGEGQPVTDIVTSTTYTKDSGAVPAGAIITETNYNTLPNLQTNFEIHGNAPIETTRFFVNRGSDIYDLSKDRVVTVVYQYQYEESDEHGRIEQITERHVINIHIQFKSGVPTVGQLQPPAIVLPGSTVGLKNPNVTPGAYDILGGGYEIFTTQGDAEKHQNGKEYINNATPMYWYQNDYYVAYYAKTYLGKTYSNAVPFKVANYHDIADVMAHPEYMYVDNPKVQRNSKIYISDDVHDVIDTPADGDTPAVTHKESEIDMLYSLFNVSLESNTENKQVQKVDAEDRPLYFLDEEAAAANDLTNTTTDVTSYPVWENKVLPVFDDHARNLANLDFFLSDNVSTAKTGGWTSIGSYDDEHPENGECFMGTLHGMGYTISGLDHSLFENLCGYVYNLGVTGSFDKSGVADNVQTATVPDSGTPGTKIHGHVNSSWIYTTGNPASTGTWDNPTLPVVGKKNDLTLGVDGIHVFNCYFPMESHYNVTTLVRDNPNLYATAATLQQFNTGEVAYDLNGFYLNKRYSDAVVTDVSMITHETVNKNGKEVDVATGDAVIYKYWKQDQNGDLIKTGTVDNPAPAVGYYTDGGSMHAYKNENYGYVERLFADGDFIYRNGTIPTEENERHSSADARYLPIWPDDYYFFGQQLTYGYDEIERPYQPLPSSVRKALPTKDGAGKDRRLLQTPLNNVIYRTPAYYRSGEKGMAYFNPYAVFASTMKQGYTLAKSADDHVSDLVLDGREVHTGLTALDFTGFNDRAVMMNAGTPNQKFQAVDKHTGVDGVAHPELVFSRGLRRISDSDAGYIDAFEPLNDGVYFGPITDYSTLVSFETHGITQNLLAYAPTASWSAGTANTQKVLHDYFNEPVYAEHYSGDTPDANGHTYRTVEALDPSAVSGIHGHLVFKENSSDLARHYYYATSDHFLVDKQDFNAPIEYEFNPPKGVSAADYNYRMWYQRTPDNYADRDKGWEGVCLPFSAELVTTQQKGEITHFYNSALGAAYTAGKTSGHEYWLREFTGVKDVEKTDPDRTVTTALMNYPVELGHDGAVTLYGSSAAKTVASTFLWDYYYNADGKDFNGDDYRHEYDSESDGDEQDRTRYYYGQQREYENYPLSEAGKPYIVGFPGFYTDSEGKKVARYYEFDLSGTFVPQNSGTTTPAKLNPQTITFVSDTGITIRVSDDELATEGIGTVTRDDYAFYGNYLNLEAPASVPDDNNFYVLNSAGSSFDKTSANTPIAAFRPYFATTTAQRLKAPAARSIVFGMGSDTQFEPDEETIDAAANEHGLRIYAKKRTIVVESTLDAPRQVRITTAAGQVVTTFTITPGDRIATPVSEGIYITNLKKLIVD